MALCFPADLTPPAPLSPAQPGGRSSHAASSFGPAGLERGGGEATSGPSHLRGLGVRGQQRAQGVLADLIIADAYDVDRQLGQGAGAEGVALGSCGVVVGTSVQLDDQAKRGAVEVDDEPGDDLLAAELQSQDLSPS